MTGVVGADPPAGTARVPDRARPALDRPLDAFDRALEARFERWRGRPGATLAAVAVSNLADYGLAWSVVAAAKGRRAGPARRRALQRLAVSGTLSWIVNAATKRAVGRARPENPRSPAAGGAPLPVRRPTSSSFPSGHTLASFCTAVVLADGSKEMVAYLAFASAVAASRVQVRAHHPSDVAGGALIGIATGVLGRSLLRAVGGNAAGRSDVGQA